MAAAGHADRVEVVGDRLVVRNLEVSDPDIVSYFGGLGGPDQRERGLERALRIGVLSIASTGTSQNVDFVEKAFKSLGDKFDRKMDAVFDEKGPLSDVIARHFGGDGAVIREHLNPDREGSPLHALREYLGRTLEEIRNTMTAREAAREATAREAAKGTRKGRDFEAQCGEELDRAAGPHSDLVERTADVSGRAGRSKKGDFVATLDGGGQRIVFEMKDTASIGPAMIRGELKEAMDNRDAAYGVLVARSRASLPDSVGWFNEYDGNKLVCAVEDEEGNPAIGGEMIQTAYRWARARLGIMDAPEAGEVDTDLIAAKAAEIGGHAAELARIRRECTNIDKSSENIRVWAASAEKGIRAQLDEIVESLKGA